MTRLSEALERARTSSSNPVPTLVSRSGEGAPSPDTEVPSIWQLDEETIEMVDARASRVEVPNTWQLDRESIETLPPIVERDAGRREAAPESVQALMKSPETAVDCEQFEIRSAEPEKLVVGPAADTAVVEQYRRLAAAFHHAQLETGARKLMVTSAVEAEGKTLTATNLALTLSESYQRRVLLIDADLRRPAIHHLIKLDNRVGLGEALKRAAPGGQLPVQKLSPTLWVITAGRPDPDPMSGLVSETMKQFLAEAAEQFDWIVIDTPPVALLPDANLLAAMVDTALLVVSARTTPYPLVARAIDAIGRSRILGVVLNRAEASEAQLGYEHHKYSYRDSAQREPTPPRSGFFRRRRG